ncbi:hypothetical protein B0H10DRAFT_2282171 [Mycena sp. CBHHK59/15]|nr:hypothetical protein B0H10DRAFT_2282171 [Mycena sp. CBHHK59/15]
MNVLCQHCSALHWIGEKTVASSQGAPLFGSCCNHGKVELPLLVEPPVPLKQLFTGMDTQSKEFRKNMAQYKHGTVLYFAGG